MDDPCNERAKVIRDLRCNVSMKGCVCMQSSFLGFLIFTTFWMTFFSHEQSGSTKSRSRSVDFKRSNLTSLFRGLAELSTTTFTSSAPFLGDCWSDQAGPSAALHFTSAAVLQSSALKMAPRLQPAGHRLALWDPDETDSTVSTSSLTPSIRAELYKVIDGEDKSVLGISRNVH